MNQNEIFEKIIEIIKDVFDDEDLVITRETVASDVDGWDSLNHLQLMSEIEDEFEITFTMGEVQSFSNVGELADAVVAHVNK